MKLEFIAALSLAVTISVVLPGCGDTSSLDDGQLTEETDPLTVSSSSVRYDYGTQCVENGVYMHCCKPDEFMIGARLDRNLLKCARFSTAVYEKLGAQYMDGPDGWYPKATQRNGMHSCPLGSVMIGLQATRNDLLCAVVSTGYGGRALQEKVDYGTQDSNLVHVCPPAKTDAQVNQTYYDGWALSGIHADLNRFNCAH